jgi:hypothetical protein
VSRAEPAIGEDQETPESYLRELQAAFQQVATRIDSAFSKCLEYPYPKGVSHVDLVLYPESFTNYFALWVWAVFGDRTVHQGILESVFKEDVEFALPVDLDPYDVDHEWRDTLFFEVLAEILGASVKRHPGKPVILPFYLMTPDSPRSWSIAECKWVSEEDKFGGSPRRAGILGTTEH